MTAPAPPPDRDVNGRARLGMYRLRPTLFGARLEELAETSDGARKWIRAVFPIEPQPNFTNREP